MRKGISWRDLPFSYPLSVTSDGGPHRAGAHALCKLNHKKLSLFDYLWSTKMLISYSSTRYFGKMRNPTWQRDCAQTVRPWILQVISVKGRLCSFDGLLVWGLRFLPWAELLVWMPLCPKGPKATGSSIHLPGQCKPQCKMQCSHVPNLPSSVSKPQGSAVFKLGSTDGVLWGMYGNAGKRRGSCLPTLPATSMVSLSFRQPAFLWDLVMTMTDKLGNSWLAQWGRILRSPQELGTRWKVWETQVPWEHRLLFIKVNNHSIGDSGPAWAFGGSTAWRRKGWPCKQPMFESWESSLNEYVLVSMPGNDEILVQRGRGAVCFFPYRTRVGALGRWRMVLEVVIICLWLV